MRLGWRKRKVGAFPFAPRRNSNFPLVVVIRNEKTQQFGCAPGLYKMNLFSSTIVRNLINRATRRLIFRTNHPCNFSVSWPGPHAVSLPQPLSIPFTFPSTGFLKLSLFLLCVVSIKIAIHLLAIALHFPLLCTSIWGNAPTVEVKVASVRYADCLRETAVCLVPKNSEWVFRKERKSEKKTKNEGFLATPLFQFCFLWEVFLFLTLIDFFATLLFLFFFQPQSSYEVRGRLKAKARNLGVKINRRPEVTDERFPFVALILCDFYLLQKNLAGRLWFWLSFSSETII